MSTLDRVKEAIRGELGEFASPTRVDRLASKIMEASQSQPVLASNGQTEAQLYAVQELANGFQRASSGLPPLPLL